MTEKKTLFDTIFSDMLQQPQRYGFSYLFECYGRALSEKDKGVNKDPKIQELITFLQEMTCNYASILAIYPDIFPTILPLNDSLDGVELSAFRILDLLEKHSYNPLFMNELNKQIKEKDESSFREMY